MKKTISLFVSIILLLGMTACSFNQPPASSATPTPSQETTPTPEPIEEVTISVAYHPGLAALCVPGIGEEMGYFEEEGLNINWVKFTAGPPEIAAMVSGDLQLGYIGHGAHALCAQGEADVISLSHVSNSEKILVRKNSGINSIEDLAGKRIVTQLGTSGEIILNLALKKAGLTRDDVNVYAMDMPGAVSAFIAGKADAIASWDTHNVNIRNNVSEELLVLAETADFTDEMSFPGSWIATKEYIEQNEDVVIRFARALNKIYDYRAENMDETVRLSAEFGDLDIEAVDSQRETAFFYSGKDLKEFVENGKILEIYQSQLDGFINDGKVEGGNVNDYVRIDIMEKSLDY
jgi:NitT/TauT family transport system substrate-binding protein